MTGSLIFPNHPLLVITCSIGAILFLSWIAVAAISFKENEMIAFHRSLVMSIGMPAPYLIVGLILFPCQILIAQILLAITACATLVLILPVGGRTSKITVIPDNYRFDERDTMFSRRELQRESFQYKEYYSAHPRAKNTDDRFRRKPGLLSPNSKYYDQYYFPAADAGFDTIARMRSTVDGPVNPKKMNQKPTEISLFLKQWAIQLGAHSAGITTLKPYHYYSVSGRGDRYGKPVNINHSYAIAITVEMDFAAVSSAPLAPTVAESARQYVNSGIIAIQIAKFIRDLGYSARAHIDGNYLVICPLVARDAGLGEIGRMGLLITPGLGPRVRLAIVTTDLPLAEDNYTRDYTVEDFCRHCQKCAVNCPAGSIPEGDPGDHNGVKRWKINDAACFTYWCSVGTDCGQCLRVCPYSHPNTFFHNLIRACIRNSLIFRRFALIMDDFLYGRQPKPKGDTYPAVAGQIKSMNRRRFSNLTT